MAKWPIALTFHNGRERPPVKIEENVKSWDVASKKAEKELKKGGEIYCARIWEGGISCNTLYWNGEKIIYYNCLGILPREKAEQLDCDENGEPVEKITEANFMYFN